MSAAILRLSSELFPPPSPLPSPLATRVHAVCVCDNEDYFYQHVDEQLGTLGLTQDREGRPLRAKDLVDIIDGYKGLGYGKSTEEELGLSWAVRGKVYSDSVFLIGVCFACLFG